MFELELTTKQRLHRSQWTPSRQRKTYRTSQPSYLKKLQLFQRDNNSNIKTDQHALTGNNYGDSCIRTKLNNRSMLLCCLAGCGCQSPASLRKQFQLGLYNDYTTSDIYCESNKLDHVSFEHNFSTYCTIILSLLQTEMICPQNM